MIGVELKKLGYTNLYALDISAEMLKEAKKKEVYKEFICASLSERPILQIKTGQFDALICAGTLIRGLARSTAFSEMIRIVRIGGSFRKVYLGTIDILYFTRGCPLSVRSDARLAQVVECRTAVRGVKGSSLTPNQHLGS